MTPVRRRKDNEQSKFRVLVVDDEERILNFLKSKLRTSGYEVLTASDGVQALEEIKDHEPDLVVLDLIMPRMDGLTALRELRAFSRVPVIILSARGADADKIKGLALGADDYIAKPFNPDELVARIEALRRRVGFGKVRKAAAKDSDLRLLDLFRQRAVLHGEFTLSAGGKSSYYIDGRMITLWPEGAYLIGKKVFSIVSAAGADAVGGMTMGADPIVAAVAVVSHLEGKAMPAFIVRPEVKGHGTQKRIEGPLQKGSRVAIVDDVLTTGGSLLRAVDAAEAEGCRVVKVVALLDRHQGGCEEIMKRGYDFTSILSADASGEVSLSAPAGK